MSNERYEPGYIAVEGVIGVGKSSFAVMLAARINAQLLNEEVLENPFLADFYKKRKRFAFSCQIYFLLSRYQQQQQLITRDLFRQRLVADYLYAKDSIFASINLSGHELSLYEKIAPVLSQNIPKPDIVIYLQASTPVLLERIRKRSMAIEKPIDYDYVEMLNKAYDYYFFNYSDTPLLVVKTDSIDFVANPEHFDDLIDQIHKPISGKKYYVPSADIAGR